MKLTHFVNLVAGAAGSLALTAATSIAANASAASDPVQNEIAIETTAHSAALSGDDTMVDAQLSAAGKFEASIPTSVLLARRAAMVCGWLQNENKYGPAEKLAARAVKQLSSLKEDNDGDRVERLYWEALLQGQMLDQKKAAIALLEEAKALAPDDDRIVNLEVGYLAAVAEFGR